jgi:Phage tail lysozyme
MATLNELIVKLTLDASDFSSKKDKVDKGLKDTGNEAEKASIKLKKTGKEGSQGFDSIAKSAIKFLAIIGGTVAIKRFAQEIIDSSAALNRLSENINLSVSTISAWSNAAELSGGSAQGLQGTMEMLSRSQTQLKLTGESSLLPYFSALGISLSDVTGKARPVDDVLLDLSDRFSKLDRTTAFNMAKMMGLDEGTTNVLLKGRTEVELIIKRQKEYAAVTKQQAEASNRLQHELIQSKQNFEAFGRELFTDAIPAIEKVLHFFEKLGDWVRTNKEFLKDFLITTAIGFTALGLASITVNWGLIAAGLRAIVGALAAVNWVAVGVVALAAAIALLWDDYQTFQNGGDSLIDWKKWEPGIKFAIDGLKMIRDYMADIVYVAMAGADAVIKFFKGDFKGAKVAAEAFWKGRQSDYNPANPSTPSKKQSEPLNNNSSSPKEKQQDIQNGNPGSSKESSAIAYFQAQGWTKEQAAGIVANLKRESQLDANAVGDKGQAFGIAQWHKDRQDKFKAKFGKDIKGSSLPDQLAFVQYELTQGDEKNAGKLLRGTTTASGAGAVVSANYERPRDKMGEASKRGQLADQLLQGIPNASNMASASGAMMVASANAPMIPTTNNNKSIENNIGEVKIYTQATDAEGIAKDMNKSLNYLFTAQGNVGLF